MSAAEGPLVVAPATRPVELLELDEDELPDEEELELSDELELGDGVGVGVGVEEEPGVGVGQTTVVPAVAATVGSGVACGLL